MSEHGGADRSGALQQPSTDVAVEAASTLAIDVVLLDGALASPGISGGPSGAVRSVRAGRAVGLAALSALDAVQPGLAARTAFLTSDPPESGEIDGHPVLAQPFAWAELSTLPGRLRPRSG